MRVFRAAAKRAWSELRAEWKQEKPGLKADVEESWRELVKDVEVYMKKKNGKKGKEGKGGGEIMEEGAGKECD